MGIKLKKIKDFIYYLTKVVQYKNYEGYLYLMEQFDKGFLKKIGWSDSFVNKLPMNEKGQPIPWMSYSIIEFLKERLKKDMEIFEFGSGNSTLFFSEYVRKVVSVEHDKEWYAKFNEKLPENTELIYQELEYDSEYCRVLQNYRKNFDIIFIDGRDRVNCLKNSYQFLTEKGVIIFDDMYRKKYYEVIPFLESKGFKNIFFSGLSPGQFLHHKTMIFYRPNNILGV